MSDVEAKLKAVESHFRKGFKSYDAARYIVRANREIPEDEKRAICQEIPIALKTLEGVFTKIKKLGLYPPQETSDTLKSPSTPERPQEASHQVPEIRQPTLEYATKEDFETLRDSINNLASLFNEERPSNPGEDEEEEDEDDDEMIPQGEMIPPGELLIQDGSSTREAVYIKPKTQMYFDMARQGAFHNYPGTRELGPFANFNGTISDFFNIIVDEFFIRNYNADIGLTMRMPVK